MTLVTFLIIPNPNTLPEGMSAFAGDSCISVRELIDGGDPKDFYQGQSNFSQFHYIRNFFSWTNFRLILLEGISRGSKAIPSKFRVGIR